MIGCAYLTIPKQFVNLECGSRTRQRVMSGRGDSLAGGAALSALESNRQCLFDQPVGVSRSQCIVLGEQS